MQVYVLLEARGARQLGDFICIEVIVKGYFYWLVEEGGEHDRVAQRKPA